MSTDTPQGLPPSPPQPQGYVRTQGHRRGPIVKHPEGQPLPLMRSAALKRASRSKYEPHVGLKQQQKQKNQ